MLSQEAQQRAREALRRVDQNLATMVAAENALSKQAESFRDNMFGAFQFVEHETMTLQEVQVQIQREGKQRLQVLIRGRISFVLVYEPEPAYDSKPQAAAQGQAAESAAQPTIELATRLFAVLTPPHRGLLRYYTIFTDGSWKRTTFSVGADGVHARSTLVPRSTPDVLVLEAVDLLGYVSLLHVTWQTLTDSAETFSLDMLQDRAHTRIHLSGLGAPRRH